MTSDPVTEYERLPAAAAARIDARCDQFEDAWRAYRNGADVPSVSAYLEGIEGAERAVLARELMALDQAYRVRHGLVARPANDVDHETLVSPRLAQDGAPAAWHRPQIPGLELREILGVGGMGVVYRARQAALNRDVAVKFLREAHSDASCHRERFQKEARAVAQLEHPHIVHVYDYGEIECTGDAGSQPYLVMEYVAGGNLAGLLRGLPQPPAEAAALVETLAGAIHYAHDQGIIHRDLKPANVLLSATSGAASSPAKTVPKITDFGLAKIADEAALTQTHDVLGTPGYMSPEQLESKHAAITRAVDVYGLGAILYEALTGRPPFRAATAAATAAQVQSDDPVPPRRLQPTVPRDLETICLKCLRKSPGQRYASARDLADDLRRFLDGQPIVARPVRRLERMWRWCLREPRVAALLALLLLTVAAGFGGVFWQWRHARAQATLARAERDIANRERARAEENFRNARAVVARLSQLADDLRHQPRLDKTRRLLLAEVSAFYERFLAEKSADRGVRLEAARVCNRLAEVRHWLGQWDEESEALRRGAELIDGLLAESPTDPGYRRERAIGYRSLGKYLWRIGQEGESERAYQKAAVIDEALVAEFPRTPEYRSDLANDLQSMAERQRPVGRTEEARANFLRAIALQRELLASSPSSPNCREELALSLDCLSRLLWGEGKSDEAEVLCREALDLRQKVLQVQPQPTWSREYLARSQANLALILRNSGRHGEAESMYRQRIATTESLVSDYPDAPDYLAEQTRAWTELCFLQTMAAGKDDAERSLRRSLSLYRQLLKNLPGTSEAELRPQANLAFQLGGLLRRLGHDREAIRFLEESVKSFPGSAVILNQTAWILLVSRDAEVHSPSRAVELARKSTELAPGFSTAWNTLGAAYYRIGNLPAARESLEKAIQLRPGGTVYDWLFLGMVLSKMGDQAQARQWHAKAVSWIKQNRPEDEDLARLRKEAEAQMADQSAAVPQQSTDAGAMP